ncbi:MAG: hypothetical protein IKV81_00020 [Clostridia bacterium]|nr:hypothetical protein [Clostridia bacterium]
MNDDKKFPYIDPPTKTTPPILNKDLDLQEIHSECVQELGLQQSKRDQLIAFYLTITGLVSAYLFSSGINPIVRILIFFALFVLGCIWSTITIRYKIYKEIYWMSCKTISSLFSVDRDKIDKAYVQHTFYCVIKKCYKSIPKDESGKNPNLFKFIIKNLTSAEYLMFLTIVLLTAASGGAGLFFLFYTLGLTVLGYIAVLIFLILFISYQTVSYNKAALSVFKVMQDELNSSFNKVFEKAWHLHFFA